MNIERLNWDSEFFKYEVAKVNINKSQSFNFDLFYKLAQPFKLVYIFSEDEINCDSIKLVDQKVILRKQPSYFEKSSKVNSEIINFNPKAHNYIDLRELAISSAIYSRFSTDINFKDNECRRLYTSWIDKSIEEKNLFEVIVYQKNEEILGFITFDKTHKSISKIGLIAVNAKSRGMNVATQLIEEAQNRVSKLGFDFLEVTTQLQNIPALNLYKKCRFEITEVNNIYHYWNI